MFYKNTIMQEALKKLAFIKWLSCFSLMAISSSVLAEQQSTLTPNNVSPDSESRQDIGLEEFKKLFMGKTVYFEEMDGTAWGREYYTPDGNTTIFKFWDGFCLEGHWSQQEPRYCFHYRKDASCWLTYWENGDIIVVSEDGMKQRVHKIVDNEPLSCQPEVYSAVSWMKRFF